jgi:TPR repeat protein
MHDDQAAITLGIQAYEGRDFKTAIQHLLPVARKFAPRLEHSPARDTGSRPLDARTAFDLLRVVEDHFPAAKYRAAKSLMYGYNGVPPEANMGGILLRQAAEERHPEAQAHLGTLFANRRMVIHAYKWLTLAGTERAIAYRDKFVPEMTPVQLAAGKSW